MARNPFDDATNRQILEDRARYIPNMPPLYEAEGDPAILSTPELYAILRHRSSYPYVMGGNGEYHEHRRRIRREIRKRRAAAKRNSRQQKRRRKGHPVDITKLRFRIRVEREKPLWLGISWRSRCLNPFSSRPSSS